MVYRYLHGIASLILSLAILANEQTTALASRQMRQMDISAIDAYVTGQMTALKIPGASIGIVRGDQIEYVQGYGVADDSGRAMTPQTPFLIASFSKSITALGVMQLADEGRIELDAPVQTYIPWFQVADAEYSSQITVRRLLNQTSGFSELEGDKRNLIDQFADDALEESIRELKNEKLKFQPGEVFEYSNTNYDILGLLIQTVSGQSYESYIQERIFAPLGMTNSFTSLEAARAANMAGGYYPLFGFQAAWEDRIPYSRIIIPSTGLFSTAEDMSRYLIAHLNEGNYEGVSIVSPEGMQELHTPGVRYSQNAGYAMGWVVFPFTEAANPDGAVPTGLAHGGRWIAYRSLMILIPDRDVGVVVMFNKSDPGRENAMDNIGWSLAMLALGLEPLETPTPDFLSRYGRGLLLFILILLGFGLIQSARRLRLLSSQQESYAAQRQKIVRQAAALILADLALAGILLFLWLPQQKDTIPLALNFRPDIGAMYATLLILTLGGAVTRIILIWSRLK